MTRMGTPQGTANGCEGLIGTGEAGDGHGLSANVFGILNATYTDAGGTTVGPLTADDQVRLQPKHRQAEHYMATGSISGESSAAQINAGGAEGSMRVGDIQHGEWISFEPVNFLNIEAMQFRVSSGGAGGDIEIRVGGPEGELVGSVTVENTGGYDNYETVQTPITDPGGTHTMYLVFTNPDADGSLFDVDSFTAIGKGISDNAQPSVTATADPTSGAAPLDVAFTAEGTDPEDAELTYSWDFGDGATSTEQNPTHTYTEAGEFQATVTVTDPGGATATDSVEIGLFAPAESCLREENGFCVADLSSFFNNDGIATEDNPGDGAFDTGGISYAAGELPEPGPVTHDGVPYEFPNGVDDGVENTVEARGQTLGLFAGNYGKMHVLASAHNGSVDATATVTYTDGSTEQIPMQLSDWAVSPEFGEDLAFETPYRYDDNGQVPPPVFVFHQAIALNPDKEAQFLTLPDDDRLHLFSITLDESTFTPQLTLAPETGGPYIGDMYALTATVGTGGAPTTGEDVTFEVYRQTSDTEYAFVSRETLATDDAGEASFSYTSEEPSEDVVVACTATTSCVDGDVLTFQDGEAQNLSGDAELTDTATVTWNDEFELEEGFEWLFDGTQASLDDWSQAGPGGFEFSNGVITSQGGLGLFWYDAQQFGNFNLRMQWKTEEPTDNSGVFVRFPDPGDDPFVAVDNGYEIQIYDAETGEPQKTGSIYNFDEPDARNSNPAGVWNDYEIEVVGRQITVTLNGEVVNEFTGDGSRPLSGFIGLQNHGDADVVSFRNIRIDELPDTEPEPGDGAFFDTIGITDPDHLANAEIEGDYAFAAELMPDGNQVVMPEDDDDDDVPVRLPDTSGEVPNLAATNGQTFTIDDADQQTYETLHVFGAATDAGQGAATGTFTLTFQDRSTEEVEVSLQDWGYPGTESADNHVLIGPMEYRHTTTGNQTAPVPFYLYHAVIPIEGDQTLVSVTLPEDIDVPEADPDVAELYTMAMTFETADGAYVTPDLAAGDDGQTDDTTPPTVQADVEGDTNDAGEYTGPVTITLSADDGDGSGIDVIEYRVSPQHAGHWHEGEGQVYTEPLEFTEPGIHTLQFRATDMAGNVSDVEVLEFTIASEGPDAPDVTATLQGTFTGELGPHGDTDLEVSGDASMTVSSAGTSVEVSAAGLEPKHHLHQSSAQWHLR